MLKYELSAKIFLKLLLLQGTILVVSLKVAGNTESEPEGIGDTIGMTTNIEAYLRYLDFMVTCLYSYVWYDQKCLSFLTRNCGNALHR